jgi:hypothetical protein
MNYDAGHFRGSGPRRVRAREHLKTGLGRARALLRDDTWYQRFVPEVEARRLFEDAGMRVIDEKMFNSDLKTAFKAAPDDRRDELMRAWLDAELAFNAAGIRYTDALARTFRTRCFELRLV